MQSLVTADWLANELGAADLRIVDASWHLPDAGRDAAAEYDAGHIPGAVFLDLASLVDAASPLDNTLPGAEPFAERMGGLGIGEHDRIVVYDDSAVKTSARAWFMLTLFGARRVAILDGGLAAWREGGHPLEIGDAAPVAVRFAATLAPGRLRGKADMLANLAGGGEQVADARGAPRFRGDMPEPRPGLAAGHIPGARNAPYADFYRADGTFKDRAGIAAAFAAAGIDPTEPMIATCGSGVTACVLLFGLHLLGNDRAALYDGSWAEWGIDPDTPKAAGPA